jgi:hypothetical protein
VDLYVLGLKGVDVILKAQLLKKLSQILMDYYSLTISFMHQNKCIELTGDTCHSPSSLSQHQLEKLLRSDSYAQLSSLRVFFASPTTPEPQTHDPTIHPHLNHVLE